MNTISNIQFTADAIIETIITDSLRQKKSRHVLTGDIMQQDDSNDVNYNTFDVSHNLHIHTIISFVHLMSP